MISMLIATSLFVLSPHIQPVKAADTKPYGYLATFVARYEPDTINIGRKTYKVTAIGNKAFCGLKQLTSITKGSNIVKIGKKALYNCKRLVKVKIISCSNYIKNT